jgi:hypothetical protein
MKKFRLSNVLSALTLAVCLWGGSASAQSWLKFSVGLECANLSADASGLVMSTTDNKLYRWKMTSWEQIPVDGRGFDITLAKNNVYVIGLNNIVHVLGSTAWTQMPNSPVKRIYAEPAASKLWAIGMGGELLYASTGTWAEYPSGRGATDICAYNGIPFVIGGDTKIYRGAVTGCVELPGGGMGKKIAVDPTNGTIWVIGMDDGIYYFNGGGWVPYGDATGRAIDIAASGGYPYVIGTDGDFWKGTTQIPAQPVVTAMTMPVAPPPPPPPPAPTLASSASWQQLTLNLQILNLSADAGQVVANYKDENIVRWDGTKFVALPGGNTSQDVAVSGGTFYCIGNDTRIWQNSGSGGWFMTAQGAAKRLTSDNRNQLWAIGTDNGIWSRTGQSWAQYPGGGAGSDIAAYNGVPYVIGTSTQIYRGTGSGWEELSGSGLAKKIAIDQTTGTVWVIGMDNGIYYHNGTGWTKYGQGEGLGVEITAQGGFPLVVGMDGNLWKGKLAVTVGPPPATVVPTTPPPPPPPPPAPVAPADPNANACTVAIADAAFNTGFEAIKKEAFSDNKKTVLQQAFGKKCLSIPQIRTILTQFSFSSDKVDMAKYLYHRCIAKDDYYLLNDSFSFSSDREELANYVKSMEK